MYDNFLPELGVTAACFIPIKNGFRLFYEHNHTIYSRNSLDMAKTFSEAVSLFDSPTNACVSALRVAPDKILFARKRPLTEKIQKLGLGGANHHLVQLNETTEELTDLGQIEAEEGCFYVMNDRLLQLKNGRIILPEAVHPKENYDKKLETAGLCGCSYSDDMGQTWKQSNWIAASNPNGHLAEPMVVESTDKLFMFMRNTTGYLHQSISLDNGETWQPETQTTIRMPCAPFCVKRDPFSGYMFIVWDHSFPAYPQHQFPRSPICLGVRRDDTGSWERIGELDHDPDKSYGYPALFFTPTQVVISYYQSPTRYFNPSNQQLKLKVLSRKELTVQQTTTSPLF